MAWTFRQKDQPPPHQHNYPRYNDNNEDIRCGDEWECVCGKSFTVVGLRDYPDGECIEWIEGPEYR